MSKRDKIELKELESLPEALDGNHRVIPIVTGEDGKLWLKYRRKKNELRASVKLLPEAVALIEKYHDDSRDTLFPMIHYPSMRNHMKALAVLAGIKENLCYHLRRHIKFSFLLKFKHLQIFAA